MILQTPSLPAMTMTDVAFYPFVIVSLCLTAEHDAVPASKISQISPDWYHIVSLARIPEGKARITAKIL